MGNKNYLTGEEEKEASGWFRKAAEVAKQSLCDQAKYGAIIVKNNEIIGSGYNAPPKDSEEHRTCANTYDLPKGFKYDRTCCLHAEWRAIFDALRRNPGKLAGARIYIVKVDENGEIQRAGEPRCSVCSRMILDTGITEAVLWHEKGMAVYTAPEYDQLSFAYLG